MLVNIYNWGQ